MSKELSISSFYDLMYSEEDSVSNPTSPLPLPPINYDGDVPDEGENPVSTSHFEGHDNLYLVGGPCLVLPLSSLTNGNNMEPRGMGNNKSVQDVISSHPGPPWFRWQEGRGYLEYQVIHQGKVIQCPYIHYGVVHRILYEMGMKRSRQQQFAREVYVCPQPPVKALGVSDDNLDIFTKDVLFNFAVEQALEQLDNPEALAKVA
jgi:hypothetical protein